MRRASQRLRARPQVWRIPFAPHRTPLCFVGVPWLIHMCDMTLSYVAYLFYSRSNTSLFHMCAMTHSHVCHDSFTQVAWLFPTWRTSFAAHQTPLSFICAPWRILTCGMTSFYTCAMIHSHLWHDSFTLVTWLFPTWCTSFEYVRHDAFSRVAWFLSTWRHPFNPPICFKYVPCLSLWYVCRFTCLTRVNESWHTRVNESWHTRVNDSWHTRVNESWHTCEGSFTRVTCETAHVSKREAWHTYETERRSDRFTCVTDKAHSHVLHDDKAHSHVWHHSWPDIFQGHMCHMTHSHVWHDSFTRVTWLFNTCDMTLDQTPFTFMCAAWLFHTHDVTLSHVWRDSFTRVTWLFHTCDITLSYVAYPFCSTPSTYLFHTCAITHLQVWHVCHDSFTRVTWLHNQAPLYFVCMPWLIHKCDITLLHVALSIDLSFVCACGQYLLQWCAYEL